MIKKIQIVADEGVYEIPFTFTATPGSSFSSSPSTSTSSSASVSTSMSGSPSSSKSSSPSPSAPPPTGGKSVMMNCINWNPIQLNNLPLDHSSELTYFVLPVAANGSLYGGSPTLETKFVADVHAKGRKATFSVAGGAQNVADITAAVTQRTNLIAAIANRIVQYDYDGVSVDIENTQMNPQLIVDFFKALRVRLDAIKPGLIIGCYTQPYQVNTVYSRIQEAASGITWLSPMIYDFTYTVEQLKTLTLAWLPRVNGDRSKLLVGIAVNYGSGLTPTTLPQVLDWVNQQNLGGIGVWENTLYTQVYKDIVKAKFPIIG